MESLRVLITNFELDQYAGTQMYVHDLARRLLRLGHRPVVYTSEPGQVAERLRMATVPVVDDLSALGAWVPDVLHCQHTLETILALLQFPATPAVYVSHDWTAWFDEPPPIPRIVRFVAVDETIRDRLELVHGVPGERIRVVPNWVDLARFRPRGPLPGQPERALVFSNYARADSHVEAVREACERQGIPLDVIGLGVGAASTQPEDLLPAYDLVFAKARCALEAMAVGAAVVLCDARGLGPMVTDAEFARLRRLNFGARTLQHRLDSDAVLGQVKRYDPADAAAVSARVRGEAGLEPAVNQLVALYREAMAEGARLTSDPVTESKVLATFLRPVSLRLRRADAAAGRLAQLEAEHGPCETRRQEWATERHELRSLSDRLAVEATQARAEADHARGEADRLRTEMEQATRELAAGRARLDGIEAERVRRQEEAEELRRLVAERSDEAESLRREVQALRTTFTFLLRDRILRLPGLGGALRLVIRRRRR